VAGRQVRALLLHERAAVRDRGHHEVRRLADARWDRAHVRRDQSARSSARQRTSSGGGPGRDARLEGLRNPAEEKARHEERASETDTNFKVAEVSAKRLADECPVRGAGDDLRGHFEDWDGRPI
jgi:hypothetical protein